MLLQKSPNGLRSQKSLLRGPKFTTGLQNGAYTKTSLFAQQTSSLKQTVVGSWSMAFATSPMTSTWASLFACR